MVRRVRGKAGHRLLQSNAIRPCKDMVAGCAQAFRNLGWCTCRCHHVAQVPSSKLQTLTSILPWEHVSNVVYEQRLYACLGRFGVWCGACVSSCKCSMRLAGRWNGCDRSHQQQHQPSPFAVAHTAPKSQDTVLFVHSWWSEPSSVGHN